MPETPSEVVLRNRNTHIGKIVVPVPLGWSVDEVVAPYADGGWELDSKTDPADVEVASPAGPPAPTKESK